jgi:lipopolysaccharide export system permease protein
LPNTLIGRVVLWDVAKIALLTLVGVSGVFVLAGAVLEAHKLHLEPARIVKILPLLIPPTIPYALPTAVLFACTFVYARLSANQEIVALKACGVHVAHALLPSLLLSLLAAGAGVYLTDRFIPACQLEMRKVVMDDLEANIFAYLKQQGMIADPKFPCEIYVDEVRDGRLINAVFKQRGQDGRYDLVAKAEEATLSVVPAAFPDSAEPQIEVRLFNSVAWSKSAQGHWSDQTYRMPIPGLVKADLGPASLSFAQCFDAAVEYRKKAQDADFFLAAAAAMCALQGDFVPLAQILPTNRVYAERQTRRADEAAVEVHVRLAQSTAPIVFALLGAPLGVLLRRRDFLQIFFVSFLPVILIFYPSLVLARNLVKEGFATPLAAVWSPSLLLCVVALPLWRQVVRR